ncbi:unnamed protein product [Pedinophyceae sp. YPF-701]|nr:unnamed protein product [Pedinophyceae sp. YPF-701]
MSVFGHSEGRTPWHNHSMAETARNIRRERQYMYGSTRDHALVNGPDLDAAATGSGKAGGARDQANRAKYAKHLQFPRPWRKDEYKWETKSDVDLENVALAQARSSMLGPSRQREPPPKPTDTGDPLRSAAFVQLHRAAHYDAWVTEGAQDFATQRRAKHPPKLSRAPYGIVDPQFLQGSGSLGLPANAAVESAIAAQPKVVPQKHRSAAPFSTFEDLPMGSREDVEFESFKAWQKQGTRRDAWSLAHPKLVEGARPLRGSQPRAQASAARPTVADALQWTVTAKQTLRSHVRTLQAQEKAQDVALAMVREEVKARLRGQQIRGEGGEAQASPERRRHGRIPAPREHRIVGATRLDPVVGVANPREGKWVRGIWEAAEAVSGAR